MYGGRESENEGRMQRVTGTSEGGRCHDMNDTIRGGGVGEGRTGQGRGGEGDERTGGAWVREYV